MPNSAITQQVQGLASATSPGLVGTGAQTFAGKKTFDGGALIKGDSSGNAIATGYVGEVLTATLSNVTISPTSTPVTVGSLTLTAGTWMVYGKSMWSSSSGAAATVYRVSISTTAATEHLPTGVMATAASGGDFHVAALPRVITTSGQTIYMIAIGVYTGSAIATDATKSLLYAVRIA